MLATVDQTVLEEWGAAQQAIRKGDYAVALHHIDTAQSYGTRMNLRVAELVTLRNEIIYLRTIKLLNDIWHMHEKQAFRDTYGLVELAEHYARKSGSPALLDEAHELSERAMNGVRMQVDAACNRSTKTAFAH